MKVQRKIHLAFGAATAGIVLLACAGFQTTRNLITSDRQVAHTLETAGQLQNFLISIMDAEMQRCEFVVTGDPQYRSRCELLLQETESMRRNMGGIAVGDSRWQSHLASLDQLLERRVAFFQESFSQAQSKQNSPATTDLAMVQKGRALLDQFRTVIADLMQAEADILQRQSAGTARTGQLTKILFGAGGLFSLIVMGFALVMLRQELARREQLAERLQQSNTYNRKLLETSLDPLVTIGPNGKITDVNAATEATTGCSRAELLGTDFSDYFTEPERARAGYEQCFQQEAVRDYPLELRHRAGRSTPVLYNASVYRDEQGQVTGVFAAARDVTALNQSLAVLAESGALFRAIFEQAAVGIAQVGLDGRWLRVNQRLCAIVGYPEEELLKMTFQDITHPYDLAADLAVVDKLLAGKISSSTLEKRYIRKDHSSVSVNLTCSLVRNLTGEARYFIAVIEDISERKLAEEALRRNEAVLLEGQRLAALGSWEWNTGNDRVTWSPEMFKLFGRDPQAGPASWQAAADYFTEASWARLSAAVEQARKNGTPYECDVEVVRPDGIHRWATSRGESLCDLNGRVVVLRGTVQDITRRREAEQALQLAQFSVDHFSDAVAWLKPDASIVRVNAATSRLLGYAREELLAMRVHNLNPALPPAAWAEHWRELRQKKVLVFEAACRAKDGRLIPVEITANYMEFEGQEFNCSCLRDMTEHKRLAESLWIAQFSMERAGDAIFWLKPDAGIMRINAAASRLLGFSNQELLTKFAWDLNPAHLPPAWAEHWRELQQQQVLRFEAELRTKAGDLIPVEIAANYLQWEGQEFSCAFVRDITKRKAEANRIRQFNLELEQRVLDRTAELSLVNKELEAFAYSVSHDLRTPLRAIEGFSRLVLEDCSGQLDAESRGNLERVRAASQRMSQLIDDLLELSRFTRSEIRLQPVNLSALAQAQAEELHQEAPARRVEFVIEPGLVAQADANLMLVVLRNLLGNAWKFTGKQNAAKIEFGCTTQAGVPAYFVRDNGAGFDMAYANKLFGAFQRLHSFADFPGTGIGLATVQRVIHRHSGRVWAEAKVGHGATFYFTLPTKNNHLQNHERQSHAPDRG